MILLLLVIGLVNYHLYCCFHYNDNNSGNSYGNVNSVSNSNTNNNYSNNENVNNYFNIENKYYRYRYCYY